LLSNSVGKEDNASTLRVDPLPLNRYLIEMEIPDDAWKARRRRNRQHTGRSADERVYLLPLATLYTH
jgi:hypothetical protein